MGVGTKLFRVGIVAIATVAVVVTVSMHGTSTEAQSANVSKGKYIVHNVSVCQQCHGNTLAGMKMPWKAASPSTPFMPVAPSIRGLKAYSTDKVVNSLMTGKHPTGRKYLDPMPEYKMNKTDATAVAAYLKSLK